MQATMQQPKYVSTSQLCDRYHRSSRTLSRWPETKGFPRPVMQSTGAENLWLLSDVEKWEAENMKSTFALAS